MNESDKWVEGFITKSEDDKQFIVWDEVHVEEVGRTNTYDEAIAMALDYAYWLEDLNDWKNTHLNKEETNVDLH